MTRSGDDWGGPWSPEQRRRWRRRQMWGGRGRGRHRPGPFARGFGCLAGLVFLVVASSLILATSSLLGQLGPVPAVIAIVAVVAVLAGIGRELRRAGHSLDRIVTATERVRDGDYGVRIGETPGDSDFPPARALASGFDTMVERLERDEDRRQALLNDVSHELRTPLTIITGSLEAMLDGVHPTDAEHLAPILEETRVMARLIDDLRTLALSEAGTLALHVEPTDLDVLIGEVVRSFAGAGSAAEVTVHADAPDDLPIVEVDPVRIREVLANLVSNAVRHTPAGGSVVISATAEPSGGSTSASRLTIRVSDTGAGIDPAILPHVFDRFVKGADSVGSGLGLAIARYLVQAHGGTLEVEASGSTGTTFRATLPVTGS